jgi:Zn-dependent oligopeptidase
VVCVCYCTVQVHQHNKPGQHSGEDGKLVAIFIHDNYARPNKKSGAWMSEYRTQCRNSAEGNAQVSAVSVLVVLLFSYVG